MGSMAQGKALGGIIKCLPFVIGGIFLYAGLSKVVDPANFAESIDHYRILPWKAAVGVALYLPWIEIVCGLCIAIRRLYLGALAILIGLLTIFMLALISAIFRGLNITCGCFGQQGSHTPGTALALDVFLLAALLSLLIREFTNKPKGAGASGALLDT
jgi:uncharacterized membrane protein YphA (DoxX/SURF4 family)